jgi:hypothetical protein
VVPAGCGDGPADEQASDRAASRTRGKKRTLPI